jgi:ssDNA-binding Zn-finger/Zn-ribbon topoisomerase 1
MSLEETLCPDCGSKMISRKGQYGVFWGCSTYPKCKGTRDSMGRSKLDRAEERGKDYEADSKDETNKFSFKRTR